MKMKDSAHISHMKLLLPAVVAVAVVAVLGATQSCTIEPPLKLADGISIEYGMPEVITDIDLIWEIDPNWRDEWWYGWDADDELHFGTLDYPDPTTYEARIYFMGANKRPDWLAYEKQHVTGRRFSRQFSFGWHDMLIWSNIDSPDGTQVLVIDESDPSSIYATTTPTRVNYGVNARANYYNNPEIFYAGMPETFCVTRDPADYDYYDEERHVYVKHLDAVLYPLVYTYLVQVVLYNNNQRITGIAERSSMTSLADGVSVHTGHTAVNDVTVAYDMRFKTNLPARNGRMADICGGKLSTFGLCDMEPWARSRATRYSGSRTDLDNHLVVNFSFNNESDSLYRFKVTDQMRRQAHGGVITVEIDVDTLPIPRPGVQASSSGFLPTVERPDSIEHEYGM